MKHNNSDYKKTFEHQKMLQNNEIVATLKEPSAIIEYLENLIFDVIEKRKLKNKRIVLLADNLVTKQLLQSLLVCRKIVDNKKNIAHSPNQLSIAAITDNFDAVISEAEGGSINEEIFEIDTCILIDFNVLMNRSFPLMEKFRAHWKKSLWLCIAIESNKDTVRFLSLSDELIDYLPESPETFEGFVNKSILKMIDQILFVLSDNDDCIAFSKQLNGDIFNGEEHEYTILIGTNDYVEDEIEEEEEGFDKPFFISISITNYRLELSMELQDFNWDGTKYLKYEMDFEYEFNEEGNITEIEDLAEEICDRVNTQKVNVRLQ